MNGYLRGFLLVFILGCVARLSAEPLDDRATEAKLVGTWMTRPGDFWPATLSGTMTYRANHTVVVSGGIKFNGRLIVVESEGRWKITHGILSEETTKSNQPDLLRVGHVSRDVVLAISDDECWLRSVDTKDEHFLTRYKR